MVGRRKFLKNSVATLAGSILGLSGFSEQNNSSQNYLIPVDISKLPDGLLRTDLFLLMGQSNMKGRGELNIDLTSDPRIVMMKMQEDRWFVARDPIHAQVDTKRPDNAGVGPGLPFAKEVANREQSIRIGLIPCAIGGSRIKLWEKGVPNSLYDSALRRAKLAIAEAPKATTGIRAVLWLQGESDSTDDLYGTHEASLLALIDNLRSDLNQKQLPFIACTIGSFLKGHPKFTRSEEVNDILLSLPDKRPYTACVDARDLDGHIGDRVHYNTQSQLIIGKRFAEKYFDLLIRQ